jgi:hypothetical protein
MDFTNMNIKNFIDYIITFDNIDNILENCKTQSEKGFIFERLFDIVIKFGFCNIFTNNNFYHLIGNVNNAKLKKLENFNLYLNEKWKQGINHFTMNNYENFVLRYNDRIDNIKHYLQSNNYFVNFIITRYNTKTINDVSLLYSTIKNKYPTLQFDFIFNNYNDNKWILEHYILMKIDEDPV